MVKKFGYDEVDGKLVVNQEEAELVRYYYDRVMLYSDNPPVELIDEVYCSNLETNPNYTREMAVDSIRSSAISRATADFQQKLREYLEAHPDKRESLEMQNGISAMFGGSPDKMVKEEPLPIIDKDTFDQVQDIIQSHGSM